MKKLPIYNNALRLLICWRDPQESVTGERNGNWGDKLSVTKFTCNLFLVYEPEDC